MSFFCVFGWFCVVLFESSSPYEEIHQLQLQLCNRRRRVFMSDDGMSTLMVCLAKKKMGSTSLRIAPRLVTHIYESKISCYSTISNVKRSAIEILFAE